MRILLFLSFILSYPIPASAQLPNDNLADYDAARNGLVILNNSQNLLPLDRIDTIRLGLLNVGLKDDNELYNTLNTYLPTARILRTSEGANWQWKDYDRGTPNLTIMVLDATSEEALDFPWHTFFVSPDAPFIMVVIGQSKLTEALSSDIFPTLIHAQKNSTWTQSLIAQLICGGIDGTNKLTQALNSKLPIGSGVNVYGNNRLSFAPPETQSMNTQLLQDSIAAIIQDGLSVSAFPGAQVLVAKDGVVVYHEAFGYHTEQQKRAVQLTDIYDLASVTKITSALPALMKWYGEGTFDLDAPLLTYYPAARGSNKENLSFRAMLSHHARLRPWIPYWQGTLRGNGKYPWSKQRVPERINDYKFRRNTLSRDSSDRFPLYLSSDLWQHRDYRDKMIKAILKSPLNEVVEYRYSGLLFYLLPDIVSNETGLNYEDYLDNTFYRPLGATTLGFNPRRFFAEERIIPTERDSFFRMRLLHGDVHDEGAAMMGGLSANAGLFANAVDLAKMMQMYLNGGAYGGTQFITTDAVNTFNQRYYTAEGNRRGLGFDKPLLVYDEQKSSVAEAASQNSFGHSGYTGTFTWMDPDNGLLYIFLSNRVYPSRNNRGIYTQNIRPRIHSILYKSIDSDNN